MPYDNHSYIPFTTLVSAAECARNIQPTPSTTPPIYPHKEQRKKRKAYSTCRRPPKKAKQTKTPAVDIQCNLVYMTALKILKEHKAKLNTDKNQQPVAKDTFETRLEALKGFVKDNFPRFETYLNNQGKTLNDSRHKNGTTPLLKDSLTPYRFFLNHRFFYSQTRFPPQDCQQRIFIERRYSKRMLKPTQAQTTHDKVTLRIYPQKQACDYITNKTGTDRSHYSETVYTSKRGYADYLLSLYQELASQFPQTEASSIKCTY